MMQTNTSEQQESIKAWAAITVKMWQDKILMLDVWDEGLLYRTFVNHVILQANGDVAKIEFLFKEYGIYQDMGVGKEISRNNSGDLGFSPKRQPKAWYSKVFYREVMKLKEFMAFRYGKMIAASISEIFGEAFDRRFKSNEKTIGSLRTQLYRDKQAIRNFRNYRKRRLGPNWKEWYKNQGVNIPDNV